MPLADLLVGAAAINPSAVSLAMPDEQFSFAELLSGALEVARGLLALGVDAGEHVGLLMPNSFEFVTGLFGTAMVGAVAVPLHVRSTSRELAWVVDHARLRVVLTTDRVDAHAPLAERLRKALPGLGGTHASSPAQLEAAPCLRHVVLLRGAGGDGVMGAADFWTRSRARTDVDVHRRRCAVRVRDPALILYTSGTTSHPKGCVLSHEAITRGSTSRPPVAFPFGFGDPVTMWCPLPLFHIAALQGFLYCVATGQLFVTDVHLDPGRALESILAWRADSLWGMFMPPLRELLTAPAFDASELSFVRSIITVGPASELRDLQALFPQAMLINGAGMSETAGWFCMSSPDDTPELRATTAGLPVPGAEIRIVHPESGLECSDGERGELMVRTYTMLDEYYRAPEQTAAAIDGQGWLHTGDLFVRYASGHLVYEGRIKDMLKVGGENVPAIEVEAFLCGHPAVRNAEVVGLVDERLDEVPVAFVELNPGQHAAAEELIAHCRGELASFKVPRAVHLVTEGQWPMSATKVDKTTLRLWAADHVVTAPQ